MANASVANKKGGGGTRSRKKVKRDKKTGASNSYEKAWWKIHVAKAVKLVERCTKLQPWDLSNTKRVLNFYHPFLLQKKEVADYCDG